MQLDASLLPDSATGTVLFANGESYGFEVPLTAEVSGFYPVVIPPAGGSLSATSWSGAELTGTRTDEEITGTLTPPNGDDAADFQLSDPNLEEGEDRWIAFSEDGQLRIKGAKRQATSSGVSDKQE